MNQHEEAFSVDTAKAFADALDWSWKPGMLVYGGGRITERTAAIDIGVVPEYRDDATRGCILGLIRKRWKSPRAHVDVYRGTTPKEKPFFVWVEIGSVWSVVGRGDTEADAMLDSLTYEMPF